MVLHEDKGEEGKANRLQNKFKKYLLNIKKESPGIISDKINP